MTWCTSKRGKVNQGLVELDLLRQLPHGMAQLLGVERFEVWQFDHRQP